MAGVIPSQKSFDRISAAVRKVESQPEGIINPPARTLASDEFDFTKFDLWGHPSTNASYSSQYYFYCYPGRLFVRDANLVIAGAYVYVPGAVDQAEVGPYYIFIQHAIGSSTAAWNAVAVAGSEPKTTLPVFRKWYFKVYKRNGRIDVDSYGHWNPYIVPTYAPNQS